MPSTVATACHLPSRVTGLRLSAGAGRRLWATGRKEPALRCAPVVAARWNSAWRHAGHLTVTAAAQKAEEPDEAHPDAGRDPHATQTYSDDVRFPCRVTAGLDRLADKELAAHRYLALRLVKG